MTDTESHSRAASDAQIPATAPFGGPVSACWPTHLQSLAGELPNLLDQRSRDRVRGEAWLLLNAAISRFLRAHTAQLGQLSREDREDIAAEKSLDLLRRIEKGTWDMAGRRPAEIAGFLSSVARNGMVDRLRELGRNAEPRKDVLGECDVSGLAGKGKTRSGPSVHAAAVMGAPDPPDRAMESREFAAALRDCAAQLQPRSRWVWLLRVFGEMSSKQIATHPDVRLKASHVDVLLQRARQAIRKCMVQKGYDPQEMPPGTFIELWEAFRHG